MTQEQNQDSVATENGSIVEKSRHSEPCIYLPAKSLVREPQEHTTELDKELDECM